MKCPACSDAILVMTDRQGIEIDYCPNCRGIWLDRGELDKLLERAAMAATPASAPVSRGRQQPDFEDADYRDGRRYSSGRKKSWLSDFFD